VLAAGDGVFETAYGRGLIDINLIYAVADSGTQYLNLRALFGNL